MGKVTELTVTKGKTVRAGEKEEWTRVEYSVKTSVDDSEDPQVARANIEGMIDGWLRMVCLPGAVHRSAAKPSAQLPGLDPDELAKLPWKTYRTKEDCKPQDAGWIFRNTKGAEALADLIEKQGKGVTVQIGQHRFEVKFSGADSQFIGRAPIKSQA
jgi:hypothetical protein